MLPGLKRERCAAACFSGVTPQPISARIGAFAPQRFKAAYTAQGAPLVQAKHRHRAGYNSGFSEPRSLAYANRVSTSMKEAEMTDRSLVERAKAEGIRLTSQRALVCAVLDQAKDHPNVDDLFARAREEDPTIAIATVYRTLKVLEDHKLIARHGFGQRKARYEIVHKGKHDHLIDIGSGKVLEFSDPALDKLVHEIAARMGYKLEHHQIELYGRRTD